MQIVIDIDDNLYTRLFDNGVDNYNDIADMARAIRNGIPLPEGHGRLGDLDRLETEMVNGINAGNYEEGYEAFAHINDMYDCVDCVGYAPTIIEADKKSEE